MICLRCGFCCIMHDVIIIHPGYIQEKLNIDDLPYEGFLHKETYTSCPYLVWDLEYNQTICTIHHYPWYELTPCYSHGQIEKGNSECRLGRHVWDNWRFFSNILSYPVSDKIVEEFKK